MLQTTFHFDQGPKNIMLPTLRQQQPRFMPNAAGGFRPPITPFGTRPQFPGFPPPRGRFARQQMFPGTFPPMTPVMPGQFGPVTPGVSGNRMESVYTANFVLRGNGDTTNVISSGNTNIIFVYDSQISVS